LLFALLRTGTYKPNSGWLKFALQLLFASLVMIIILWFGNSSLETWFAWSNINRIVHLGILLSAAIIGYFGCLLLSGIRLKQFLLNE